MPPFEELKVFSGTAHPKLAQAVCDYLNIPLGKSNVFKFRNPMASQVNQPGVAVPGTI